MAEAEAGPIPVSDWVSALPVFMTHLRSPWSTFWLPVSFASLSSSFWSPFSRHAGPLELCLSCPLASVPPPPCFHLYLFFLPLDHTSPGGLGPCPHPDPEFTRSDVVTYPLWNQFIPGAVCGSEPEPHIVGAAHSRPATPADSP
jgi:hypothetical protein